MIRRMGFLAVSAFAGVLFSVAAAHALSAATTQCVRTTRQAFRACQIECRRELQAAIPGCFGPGASCAAACQTRQNACLDRVADGRASCQEACIDTRDTAIAACRDLTDATEEANCITAARAAAVACRQACRDGSAAPQRECNVTANDCLESCASIPPPAR